ncbi:hypothetical protein H8959_018708 [Pygathrix nigripes]
MMFRDQVGILAGWFKGWNECEQTVALLSLLKRVTRTQARFLQLCLEHSLADCNDIHLLESEANSAVRLDLKHKQLPVPESFEFRYSSSCQFPKYLLERHSVSCEIGIGMDCPVPGPDLEINPTLESLCLSMTEHALGDGTDKTSTI